MTVIARMSADQQAAVILDIYRQGIASEWPLLSRSSWLEWVTANTCHLTVNDTGRWCCGRLGLLVAGITSRPLRGVAGKMYMWRIRTSVRHPGRMLLQALIR